VTFTIGWAALHYFHYVKYWRQYDELEDAFGSITSGLVLRPFENGLCLQRQEFTIISLPFQFSPETVTVVDQLCNYETETLFRVWTKWEGRGGHVN
jgi:hypothetical protein